MSSLVYVAGVAMTPFGKSDLTLPELMVQAGQAALDDSGLAMVEALYLGVMNPAEFTGDSNLAALLADQLNLEGVPAARVETASSTGAGVLEAAFYAVASGYIKTALVVAGEKMTHLPTDKTTKILARVIDNVERQYGASMPALAAMIARRYAHEHKLSGDDLTKALCAVAVKNHANGSLNPLAQFRRVITAEHYLRSKMVADPLRIFDCAPITDGAAAVVLTSARSQVCLAGLGHATDTLAVGRRGSLTSFNSTKMAALKAYKMAQISPRDVDLAEVHDAFTTFEVIGTEDLGFFDPGQGWRAVQDGLTARDGQLPVNASGGLKARGHPVGASGLAQVVELVWQMRRQLPPERQLPKVNVGLAQSIGGLANNNLVTVLTRSDLKRVWQVNFEPDYHRQVYPPRPLLKQDKLYAGRGELLTWTVLYTPPEGFTPPLPLGYVRMSDDAVILALGLVENVETMPRLGDKVAVDVDKNHFVFKHYDPKAAWRKPFIGLKEKIVAWWGAVEGQVNQAARMTRSMVTRPDKSKEPPAPDKSEPVPEKAPEEKVSAGGLG